MPEKQDREAMRRNGQLNDVSCMIRRDVFNQFEYRGKYAEDLDLGLRLIRAGYSLALLSGVYVIHSHNRTAFYYLKRHLVGITTQNQILPDWPAEKIEEETTINQIIGMVAGVRHYVKELTEAQNIPVEKELFFDWSYIFFDIEKRKLQTMRNEDIAQIFAQDVPFCDKHFHDFVHDLYMHTSKSLRVDTYWFDNCMNNVLTGLRDYFTYTGESFNRKTIEEIAEMFAKHCGQFAGEKLASYVIEHPHEDSFLNDWARELQRGV